MTTTAFDDQFTDAPEPVHQPYSTADILRRNVADLELALKQQADRAEAAEAELLAVREDNHSMMLEIDGLRKELAKMRNQKPALYMAFSDCGNFIRYWTRDTKNLEATMAVNDFEVFEFYAAPVPAPAVPDANPVQWLEDDGDMILVPRGLLGAACSSIDKQRPAPKVLEALRYYTMNAPQAPAVPEFCAAEAQLTLAETEMLNAKAWSAGTQAKRHIDFAITAIGCARALLQSRAVRDSLTTQADCRACVNRGRVNGLSQETYCDSCVHEGRNWRKNHFLDAAGQRLLEGGE